MEAIKRIHHISAIVGDPKENVAFYEGILQLRLIKQTVNFDDPNTYHLYFGNEQAEVGTTMTFSTGKMNIKVVWVVDKLVESPFAFQKEAWVIGTNA